MAARRSDHLRGSGFLISESGQISREIVTIAGGIGRVLACTVLGQVTSSGKYVPATASASDGSQSAAAVLIDDVDTSVGDVRAAVIRRLAVVNGLALVFDDSVDADGRAEKLGELLSLGIVPRESVVSGGDGENGDDGEPWTTNGGLSWTTNDGTDWTT